MHEQNEVGMPPASSAALPMVIVRNKNKFPIGLIGFSLSLAWLLFLVLSQPISADGPRLDEACRECHGNNDAGVWTLPSGEALPLYVDVAGFAASAHGEQTAEGVLCTDCHAGKARYQYPHQPNPAQTGRDVTRAVSETCQDCHYPHSPFHQADQIGAETPVCADCHGSHHITVAENIPDNMAGNCLACHQDQTPAWAADSLAWRPGFGQAADGYVGSNRCVGCHEDYYFSWRETRHARMVQDPQTNPGAVVGDFYRFDRKLTFQLEEVVYTIGSRWVQQYLSQNEAGDLVFLPAQWHVETETWQVYTPPAGADVPWPQQCGSCHVTGLNTETWGFAEIAIGCESCHGPGAEHVADPEQVQPFQAVDDQVCGACHSRGTSPDGYPFPATYRPGEALTDHFTLSTAETDFWPDGSAKRNYQHYQEWQLDSRMAQSDEVNCVTCHAVHEVGAGPSQLQAPLNGLCLNCHNDRQQIIDHIPFHNRASADRTFFCSDCHMPALTDPTASETTAGAPYAVHSHAFFQPNPQASLDHGGLATMPNACNTCHTDLGEEPEWAAETIAYAKRRAGDDSTAFFRPGPTPTSPPPPTPIPSVGQSAGADQIRVETGRSLRNIILIVFILIILGLIWLVYRSIRTRRSGHV